MRIHNPRKKGRTGGFVESGVYRMDFERQIKRRRSAGSLGCSAKIDSLNLQAVLGWVSCNEHKRVPTRVATRASGFLTEKLCTSQGWSKCSAGDHTDRHCFGEDPRQTLAETETTFLACFSVPSAQGLVERLESVD